MEKHGKLLKVRIALLSALVCIICSMSGAFAVTTPFGIKAPMYENSLYETYHSCSSSIYRQEVGSLDSEYGRNTNRVGTIDGVEYGELADFFLESQSYIPSSAGLIWAFLDEEVDRTGYYNSSVKGVLTGNSTIQLIRSELYSWGKMDGLPFIIQEYYLFSILNGTSGSNVKTEVLYYLYSEYDGGEGLEGRIVYNNASNNCSVSSTPKASTTGQFIVNPSLYGPGTENPTLSPYHENFLDDAPWDESAVWEENTPVYMYPDQSSEVLTWLPIKAILQTCVFDGSYYYIRYNRYEGFVSVDDVDFDRPGKHMYAEYLGTGKVVNCKQSVSLRPYPNAQYDAIMQVPLGASVEVSDYNRDFYECVYRGETGYILRDYISVG